MPTYHRHSLVWLSPDGWRQVRLGLASHADKIAAWSRARRPAVVRRSDPDAGPDEVSLAVTLPPDPGHEKVRLALRAPAAMVESVSEAPLLARVLPALPAQWQAGAAVLERAASAHGLLLRTYGSAAWQAVTGLTYMRKTSDIDLLMAPSSRDQLRAGLTLLAQHAALLPLDGEIVFPSGRAVAWKEWLLVDATPRGMRVLVKDGRQVSLQRADLLLEELQTGDGQ
jgi:phosphoribosyl-dephospho-CoA transferase